MSYLKVKRDTNHMEVLRHLRRLGYEVLDMAHVGTVPDLLATKKGEVAWIEVKIPGSRARWGSSQISFIASTRFNVIVAYSGEDAALKLRERRYLTQPQKDRLAALIAIEPREFYTPAAVDELLNK
jgi:hypothetical protein